MITFNSVTKTYANGFRAVQDINIHIHEGELVALIGPSGSGKTTTMKMVNRLIEPTEGTIFINGQNICDHDPVELRRNIGYVIQHIGLLPHMTIAQNAALVPKLKKLDSTKYSKYVDELLSMVGLDPDLFRDRYPAELSGGQQQRVGVVRALAADPSIILMDEPFSALDPISREQLQNELLDLQAKLHKTILFVTHDIDEAIKIADRICIMKDGLVLQFDTPEYILRHPANDFVKSFIGPKRINQFEILPPIEEVMIKPITSRPNVGLAEAINHMRKQKVDTLLVIDNAKKLLGAIGVWEIQSHFSNEELTLADIMNKNTPAVNSSQRLSEAINLISQHRSSCLPVVDDDNTLLGVITRASLVDVMSKTL